MSRHVCDRTTMSIRIHRFVVAHTTYTQVRGSPPGTHPPSGPPQDLSPLGVFEFKKIRMKIKFWRWLEESLRRSRASSIHMSVHMPIRMSMHMSMPMSIRVSTCMPICTSTHMSVHLSMHMSTHMSIHISTCMSIHMSIHMYTCLCTHIYTHACTHVYTHVYTHLSRVPQHPFFIHFFYRLLYPRSASLSCSGCMWISLIGSQISICIGSISASPTARPYPRNGHAIGDAETSARSGRSAAASARIPRRRPAAARCKRRRAERGAPTRPSASCASAPRRSWWARSTCRWRRWSAHLGG